MKLKTIEAQSSTLLSDNDRLKRELERMSTQNEILRATTTPLNLSQHHSDHAPQQPPDSPVLGPQTYTPSTFHKALSGNGPNSSEQPMSHRIHESATTGERLLTTGAAWDMIQSHDLAKKGMVDVGDVLNRLKGRAMCDGSGPAFEEGEVKRAIEESVSGAGDELI